MHMQDLAVYVKEGLPFPWDLSLENSADSYVFDWLSFNQCLNFSCIDHLLCLYAQFLILFHLTDEVLSINPSASVFVFGDFNIHQKDWLACSDGTDRPGELKFFKQIF